MQNTIMFKKKVQENVYSKNINVIQGSQQEFTVIICRVTNVFPPKRCKWWGTYPAFIECFLKMWSLLSKYK